jgi:membrane-bound serine protease (ClpP class)
VLRKVFHRRIWGWRNAQLAQFSHLPHFRRPIISFILLFAFGASGLFAQESVQSPARVWIAEIRGTINPATSDYLKSAIIAAEAAKAEVLIVELDTPGGLVSSVREMAQTVDSAKIPVAVYVTPAGASATSAGALLMLSSHIAAMSPGTNIGAAHPVGAQGEEVKGPMGEKVLNDTSAFARGLADLRGRNREVAEAVVAKSKSFTAEEALKQRLIDVIAPSRDELIRLIHQRTVKVGESAHVLNTENASLNFIAMTQGQKLLHYLANPNIAGILLSLAILLIYVELSNPGITIAGVAGGICLLIAFMALQLLPIRVGALGLIALGMILLVAEAFVTSHGALAAGGIVSFILGLLWLLDPGATSLQISPAVWVPIAVGMGSGVAVLSIAAARMRSLSQKTLALIGGGSDAGLHGYSAQITSVTSADEMQGKAVIRGEVWDVTSPFPLHPGDVLEVDHVSGMHAHLRKTTRKD